jgi:hypothetical protein
MDVIATILIVALAVGTVVVCVALAGFTRRLARENLARAQEIAQRGQPSSDVWLPSAASKPERDDRVDAS